MDKSSYRRIGEFISPVDVRNGNDGVSRLVGLTIAKQFIPSVANTNGTDLTNYKIIRKNQFACSLMQVSRDGKMPVAMYSFDEPAIMSPAYPMFEVSKPNEILPEYLMMWFQREEFDREACFYAVGGVRGSLEWEDFCNMKLPVPDLPTQQKIVSQYQAIESRIATNKKLISNLEATAQAIFRQKYAKAYDGLHVEGLKEITIGECVECNAMNLSTTNLPGKILYLETGGVTDNRFEDFTEIDLSAEELPSRAKRMVSEGDILYSTVRPNLKHYGIITNVRDNTVVSTGFVVLRSILPQVSNELLYMWLTFEKYTEYLDGVASASKATYPSITADDILGLRIWIPIDPSAPCYYAQQQLKILFHYITCLNKENFAYKSCLNCLSATLLLN